MVDNILGGQEERESEYGATAPANIINNYFEREEREGGGFNKGAVVPIPQQRIFDLFGYLFGYLFDISVSLFGAYSQGDIGLFGGLFTRLFAELSAAVISVVNGLIQAPSGAILATVIGLFGGLNGYIFGACATDNDNCIGIDIEARRRAFY